jgi:hypothetical protein
MQKDLIKVLTINLLKRVQITEEYDTDKLLVKMLSFNRGGEKTLLETPPRKEN